MNIKNNSNGHFFAPVSQIFGSIFFLKPLISDAVSNNTISDNEIYKFIYILPSKRAKNLLFIIMKLSLISSLLL